MHPAGIELSVLGNAVCAADLLAFHRFGAVRHNAVDGHGSVCMQHDICAVILPELVIDQTVLPVRDMLPDRGKPAVLQPEDGAVLPHDRHVRRIIP